MTETLTEHQRRAGSATSPRKAKAAQRNGKLGGRPAVPTACAKCGGIQLSARAASRHCPSRGKETRSFQGDLS